MLYNNNVIRVEGTIGRDPETKFLNSGKPICECAMAMNRGKKEQELKPIWFKLKGFGEFTTGQMMSIKKGESVTVIGSFDMEQWTKDGIDHQNPAIIVETIYRKVWPEKTSQAQPPQNAYQKPLTSNQGQGNSNWDAPPDQDYPF